jgi:uncharacterized protein YdeI (YjbR/CyaY-like superfamily)
MTRTRTVEEYCATATIWRDEVTRLRQILLSCGLEESIKWGAPCYAIDGKNVVGIGAFKSYFGLWFFQGALLQDEAGVLVNAQAGKTKAMRQWRMTSATQIKPAIIRRYVTEALRNVRQGREIKSERAGPVEVPDALQKSLRRFKGATAGFRNLRDTQRREYAEYIAGAKRDDTRRRRIEKVLPMIAAGVGLNDRYRR